jgi:hypothetical protein
MKFSENMSSGAELFREDRRTDGQTERDMTKLIVAFRNFAKAPKIMQSSFVYISTVDRYLQEAT